MCIRHFEKYFHIAFQIPPLSLVDCPFLKRAFCSLYVLFECFYSEKVEHQEYITVQPPMLLLLSYFSCVRPCATPEMAARQASPSLGFSKARTVEWVAISFSNA